MDVIVISKPSFCVLGKMGQGAADKGYEWIPPLWKEANDNFNEIKQIVKYDEAGNISGMWGLMSDVDEKFERWGSQGKYLAGCEVESNAVPPDGWKLWHLPPQVYAVVSCTNDTYSEIFSSMLNKYLPSNNFQIAGAIHEHYPQPAQSGVIELYFPVK